MKLDQLREEKIEAQQEMEMARAALSDAQRCFAQARKKYERARSAYLDEEEKGWKGVAAV